MSAVFIYMTNYLFSLAKPRVSTCDNTYYNKEVSVNGARLCYGLTVFNNCRLSRTAVCYRRARCYIHRGVPAHTGYSRIHNYLFSHATDISC